MQICFDFAPLTVPQNFTIPFSLSLFTFQSTGSTSLDVLGSSFGKGVRLKNVVTITLDYPASVVDITLCMGDNKDVTLIARDKSGVQINQVTVPPVNGIQSGSITGSKIYSVELITNGLENLLCKICAEV